MQVAAVTTGLKCAPEIGPNIKMSAISAPTVAPALARSCSATSSVRFVAMMPEPTTEMISSAVPSASAKRRFERVVGCMVLFRFDAEVVQKFYYTATNLVANRSHGVDA